MRITIEWPMYTLDDKGEDVETIYDVTCFLTKGDPGCHTMRNGDPGWPPSPAECDIESIKLQGLGKQPGIDLDPILWPLLGFNRKKLQEIEQKAFEEAADRQQAAEEDAAEARYEMRREREDKDYDAFDQRTP